MAETLVRTRIHGGNPWELIRRRRFSKDEIVDFSVDLNPLGFPAGVRDAVLKCLDDIQCYPDPDARALSQAIAAYHQVPVEVVLPGNGSAELITLVTRLQPLTKALVVVPTFTEYEWAAEQAGAVVSYQSLEEADGFQLNVAAANWPDGLRGVDLVFLCNPNNPTGIALPKDKVLQLAHRCLAAGALLIVDEAFMEFVEQPELCSVVPDAASLSHVMVLRSLTKLFAVPGLRLGYLVACPSIVERLRALQQPWPLNTFALAVGAQLFNETDYIGRSRRTITALRGELDRSFRAIPGLAPFPSVTNFILCKLTDERITSDELCERLARRGILIRNCDDFTGLEPGRWIRLAVRTQDENARLTAALREVSARAA
ncbi:MAG: threonine-phosphate decarboxylase [Candidatus Omnitrophica bacterium]|nr:threonine-phosphate decarboxylase [Candidatus Omnitrophota bacterium]